MPKMNSSELDRIIYLRIGNKTVKSSYIHILNLPTIEDLRIEDYIIEDYMTKSGGSVTNDIQVDTIKCNFLNTDSTDTEYYKCVIDNIDSMIRINITGIEKQSTPVKTHNDTYTLKYTIDESTANSSTNHSIKGDIGQYLIFKNDDYEKIFKAEKMCSKSACNFFGFYIYIYRSDVISIFLLKSRRRELYSKLIKYKDDLLKKNKINDRDKPL